MNTTDSERCQKIDWDAMENDPNHPAWERLRAVYYKLVREEAAEHVQGLAAEVSVMLDHYLDHEARALDKMLPPTFECPELVCLVKALGDLADRARALADRARAYAQDLEERKP
jgi:hypothetical protein